MSINKTITCNFESILDKPCKKLDYSRSIESNTINDINPEQQSIFPWRSKLIEYRSDDVTI